LDGFTQPLKLLISNLVTTGLFDLGYPTSSNGVTIFVGEIELLVKDACSGLNSLYSLSAVGVIYTYMVRSQNHVRTGIMLAFIVPAAVLSNIFRVALLVLITYHFGEEAGQGFLHDFAGLLMFVVALSSFLILDSILYGIERATSRTRERTV